MKIGLISAIAVAVVLVSSLIYWKTRPAEGDAPAFQAPTSSTAGGSPVVLSAGPSVAEGSEGAPKNSETVRSAAAPVPIAPPALDGDLASRSENTINEINPAVPTSVEEAQKVGTEVFEKRYEGTSAEDRKAAQEAIRVLLYSNQEGELGKGQALTDEQIQEFKREIEWLSVHEFP